VGANVDLDPLFLALPIEPGVLANKTRKTLDPVQDGLNFDLNSWSPGRVFVVAEQQQTTLDCRDQLFVSRLTCLRLPPR
jgi:hypothetical protein